MGEKGNHEFATINIKSAQRGNNLTDNQTHITEGFGSVNINSLTTAANHMSKTPKRTKIETIEDRDIINTNAYINTEDTDNDDHESVRVSCNLHEFSISTLDRKLKELKKNKGNKRIKKGNNDDKSNYKYEVPKNKPINSSQQFTSTRVNNVTIIMDPSKLINEHMTEIQLRIIGHTRAAISYEKKEKIIGYPVTILSSFLTSAIMMSISSDELTNKNILKYISLILSITSFLLSVSRDYFNFARKFQSHDLSSKLYTTVLRSIEVRLINNHLDKEERRDIFKDIVDQMSIIEQYETPVPDCIDSKVRRNHIEMMEYA
jgi:hypothetical protein